MELGIGYRNQRAGVVAGGGANSEGVFPFVGTPSGSFGHPPPGYSRSFGLAVNNFGVVAGTGDNLNDQNLFVDGAVFIGTELG